MTKQTEQHVPALEARGLAVGYDGVPLVCAVDLAVQPGQIVTLIGPNGAGKSTILKTLAGRLPALAGAVCMAGRPLAQFSAHERALQMAVMLTERQRTELLTCLDVVEMGRYPHTGRLGVLSEADRACVREAMELVEVWDLRHADFMRLSDGQRQRVMLARAICQEPRIMVLDEPTSYLDVRFQIDLLRVLRALAATKGVGIVMSLHELPLAFQVSDWVVCVREGAIMAQGTPVQMFVSEVIDTLYDLEPGVFDPKTGGLRLQLRDAQDWGGGAHAKA